MQSENTIEHDIVQFLFYIFGSSVESYKQCRVHF